MRLTSGVGELLEVSSEDVVVKHLAGEPASTREAGIRDLGGHAERICRLHSLRLPMPRTLTLNPSRYRLKRARTRTGGVEREGPVIGGCPS